MVSRLLVATAAFLVLGVGAGCGKSDAGPADPGTETDAPEIRSKSNTSFVCTTPDGEADLTVTSGATAKKVAVSLGLENVVDDEGVLDPGYRPRTQNAGFVRFKTFRALDGDSEATVYLLIEKPMLVGKAGRAKLQFVSDDFNQTLYSCKPK